MICAHDNMSSNNVASCRESYHVMGARYVTTKYSVVSKIHTNELVHQYLYTKEFVMLLFGCIGGVQEVGSNLLWVVGRAVQRQRWTSLYNARVSIVEILRHASAKRETVFWFLLVFQGIKFHLIASRTRGFGALL